MTRKLNKQAGFSIVELMVSLILGLIISGAVIQMLVGSNVTNALNRAIASSQENGRFIMSRLRQDLVMVGLYDAFDPNLSQAVDNVEEAAFVLDHPVALPGDFSGRATLGSIQGTNGSNDTLVVSLQAERDCRGLKLGYAANEEFYVVNEYFVEDNLLKCRGFDGRFLRGQVAASGHNGHASYTLLDDVLSFQVAYGISAPLNGNTVARPVRYIDASELAAAYANNSTVVAIRIAMVLKGEGRVQLDAPFTYKLLNESSQTAPDASVYQAFETTISLRNMKNLSGGNAI